METVTILNQFIQSELIPAREEVLLGPDDNLLLSGLVDSHGVMRLVKFIENQFTIKVSPGEINLKNFKTINAISAYIQTKNSTV